MSYKLLEITTLYRKFIDRLYSLNPDLLNLTYREQYERIAEEGFSVSCFLQAEMLNLGVGYNVIFYNIEELQHSWKEECKTKNSFEILLSQIKSEFPDCILISDLPAFNIYQLNELRNVAGENCKFVAFHFTTVSDNIKKKLNIFDEIYTGNKFMLGQLEPYCKSVKLLYHAFEPRILMKMSVPKVENDLLFAGSIMVGYHTNRLEMISRLIDNQIPFSFYGDIYGSVLPFGNLKSVRTIVRNIIKNDKETKRLRHTERQIRMFGNSGVFGIPYYNLLGSHAVSLNRHTPIAGTGCGNVRMFEATGCGVCLLTDYKDENIDLFNPDEEIVVYNSYDELVEKARWLLDNPNRTKEIALSGQRRTLASHTYKQKAELLNEYLLTLLHEKK